MCRWLAVNCSFTITASQNYTQCFFVRWENGTLAALYRFLKTIQKHKNKPIENINLATCKSPENFLC